MSETEPPAESSPSIPLVPSFRRAFEQLRAPQNRGPLDRRVLELCGLAMIAAVGASLMSLALKALIGLTTNALFFQRFSFEMVQPTLEQVGAWGIALPVVGGLVVGLMARYGSPNVRGHGLPEALENILLRHSKVPAKMTFLKPVSAAIAIGTGGPFGAEGPIVASGAALGSLCGQFVRTTGQERKILLAAGAAAGMTATFGAPVGSILLAIELMLFEFSVRALVPVAVACLTAAGLHILWVGSEPIFDMPHLAAPSDPALISYVAIGMVMGVVATVLTSSVYMVEDLYEKLPIHWMWWPAIGGVFAGVIGYLNPHTLGIGYDNITAFLHGSPLGYTLAGFALLKFVSWTLALGSGNSGGTLAPMFNIGGALGALMGGTLLELLPQSGVDPRIAALVGMAALFSGASRAFLTSTVFAYEVTHQPHVLLPLLAGCAGAYLVSSLLMRDTIMTRKITRRGVRVPESYSADFMSRILAWEATTPDVVTLPTSASIDEIRQWLNTEDPRSQHQGYPLVDDDGKLVGVVTLRDVFGPDAESEPGTTLGDITWRPPITIYEDQSLRDAEDLMAQHDVGRLPVVSRAEPEVPKGIITRSDILEAYGCRLRESQRSNRTIKLWSKRDKSKS